MNFRLPVALLVLASTMTVGFVSPASAHDSVARMHAASSAAATQAQFETALLETNRAAECAYRAATVVIDRVSKQLSASASSQSAPSARDEQNYAVLARALQVSRLAVEQSKTSHFVLSNLDRFNVISNQRGVFVVDGQEFISISRAGSLLDKQTSVVSQSQVLAMADEIQNGSDLACSALGDFTWDGSGFEHYSFMHRDWVVRTGCQRTAPEPEISISAYWVHPSETHTLASVPDDRLSSLASVR